MSYTRNARKKPFTGMGALDEDSKFRNEQVSGYGQGYDISSKQVNERPVNLPTGGTDLKVTAGGSPGASPVNVPSDTGIPLDTLRAGASNDASSGSASASWWGRLSTPAQASVVGGGLILLAIAGSLVMRKR